MVEIEITQVVVVPAAFIPAAAAVATSVARHTCAALAAGNVRVTVQVPVVPDVNCPAGEVLDGAVSAQPAALEVPAEASCVALIAVAVLGLTARTAA